MIILSLFSISLILYSVFKYDFKARLLSIENIKDGMFDKIFKNPFTKFYLILISLLLSRFYLEVQRFKSRKDHHWIISKIYKSNKFLPKMVLRLFTLALFITYVVSIHFALLDAGIWSTTENALFYAFNPFLLIISVSLLLMFLVSENAPWIMSLWCSSLFAMLSKLTLVLFLIYPTVMFMVSTGGSKSNVAGLSTIFTYAAHNFVVGYLISFVLYLVILMPIFRIKDIINIFN